MDFMIFLARYGLIFSPGLIALWLIGRVWWRRYALEPVLTLAGLLLIGFYVTYHTGEVLRFWETWAVQPLMGLALTSWIRQANIIITKRLNREGENVADRAN
jgi:hypothetical protein